MLTYISQGGLLGDVGPKYSWGLRDAGQKIAKAYPGKVRLVHFDHTQDVPMLEAIIAAHKRGDRIMVATHSLGANGFLNYILPECAARGIVIGCAFTFDPTWNVWAKYIGNECRRLINYYNTAFFSALGKRKVYANDGFTGYLVNIPLLQLHQNMDDDFGAHAAMVREAGWLLTPQIGSATLPTSAPVTPKPTPIASNPPMQQQPTQNAPARGPDLSREFPPTDNIS